jgi:hypothetical protein
LRIRLGFSGVRAMSRAGGIGDDFETWLEPFLAVMGRATRRKWGPLYVRGLLGPDGPKSVQPIATRLGLAGHDQLHHFITSPAWDDAALWHVLAERADRLVGGDDAVLVVDERRCPRKARPRWVWRRRTAGLSANEPIASRWFRSRWRGRTCRCPSACGYSCQPVGPMIRNVAVQPACPRGHAQPRPSQRSR